MAALDTRAAFGDREVGSVSAAGTAMTQNTQSVIGVRDEPDVARACGTARRAGKRRASNARSLVTLAVALVLLVGCSAENAVEASRANLIGGTADTSPLGAATGWFTTASGTTCTGTLIAPDWILTAARCVGGFVGLPIFHAGGRVFAVNSCYIHPDAGIDWSLDGVSPNRAYVPLSSCASAPVDPARYSVYHDLALLHVRPTGATHRTIAQSPECSCDAGGSTLAVRGYGAGTGVGATARPVALEIGGGSDCPIDTLARWSARLEVGATLEDGDVGGPVTVAHDEATTVPDDDDTSPVVALVSEIGTFYGGPVLRDTLNHSWLWRTMDASGTCGLRATGPCILREPATAGIGTCGDGHCTGRETDRSCPSDCAPPLADADGDGFPDVRDGCPWFDARDPGARLDRHDGEEQEPFDCPRRCASCGDYDQDRVPDACDNCPRVWNFGQIDTDADGRGDACDSCPVFDDGSDLDGDGLIDACDPCPGFHDCVDTTGDGVPDCVDPDGDGIPSGCDLCPDIRSSGNNCNQDAELATGSAPLGDECDPALCPDTVPMEAGFREPGGVYQLVGNNHFRVDALGVPVGIAGFATFGPRFCRCDLANDDDVSTRGPAQCGGVDFGGGGCEIPADGLRARALYDLPQDDRISRWKPLDTASDLFTTARPIGSLTFEGPPPPDPTDPDPPIFIPHVVTGANEFDALFAQRAFVTAPDSTTRVFFPEGSAEDFVWTWDVQHDQPRFYPDVVPRPSFGGVLRGVLGSFVVRRPVGARCAFLPCPPVSRELSSNYWSGGVNEDRVRLPFPGSVPIVAGLWPDRVCPECRWSFPVGWLSDPCMRPGALCDRPSLFQRLPGPSELDLTDAFSPLARLALLDRNVKWLSPAESRSAPALAPFAVAVSLRGNAVSARIILASDGMLRLDGKQDPPGQSNELPPISDSPPIGDPLRGLLAAVGAPATGPGERVDHGIAYWGTQRQVFVAGGADAVTGGLMRDLWRWRLVEERWEQVPIEGSVRPERVLAMEVDFAASALLVLDQTAERGDEDGGGSCDRDGDSIRGRGRNRDSDRDRDHDDDCDGHARTRLLRIDLRTGQVRIAGSWRGLFHYTRYGLATSPNGVTYLVATNERARAYAVFALRVDGDAHITLIGFRSGSGTVLDRPVGGDGGVSLLVDRRGVVAPIGVGIGQFLPARARRLGDLL